MSLNARLKLCAFLLTVVGHIDNSQATVDPFNASYFIVNSHTTLQTHFNITNTYHRQLILNNRLYRFDKEECVPSKANIAIPYWINANELPGAIRLYNAQNAIEDIQNKTQIYTIVTNTVARVFNEMKLSTRKLLSYADYNHIIRHLLHANKFPSRIPSPPAYFIPIQVHFRPAPYPQSSFLEFVSNQNRRWELYHDDVYAIHAGNDDDLLYRLRHNLRHSLGLGHTTDSRCIMFPTNVRGLTNTCQQEIKALHQLLCNPQLAILNYADK